MVLTVTWGALGALLEKRLYCFNNKFVQDTTNSLTDNYGIESMFTETFEQEVSIAERSDRMM